MKLFTIVSKSKVLPLATLSNRYIQTVEQSGIEEATQSVQFDNLVQLNKQYQSIVDPKKSNDQTLAIDNEYKNREELFTQMHTYLNGCINSPDSVMVNAANLLFAVIDKYGTSFSRRPLGEQSVYYIRIIEGLKNSELASAVAKTMLADKIAALETAQLNYESLYIGRGNAKPKSTSPSKLRKELEQCLKKHLSEVESMAGRTGNDVWLTLYEELKQRFVEANTPMNKRRPGIGTGNTPVVEEKIG